MVWLDGVSGGCLCVKANIYTERFITEEVERQLSKAMLEGSKEEQKSAEGSGDYFQGVPAITVIADGGWLKRSHKHSYNAKSGVAVIIGIHTRKLLVPRG